MLHGRPRLVSLKECVRLCSMCAVQHFFSERGNHAGRRNVSRWNSHLADSSSALFRPAGKSFYMGVRVACCRPATAHVNPLGMLLHLI